MIELSEAECASIAGKIRGVEAASDGEIVCVVAHASSEYAYFPALWAAFLALSAPWPLIAMTRWPVQWIFLCQIAVFALASCVFALRSVRMRIVPRIVQRSRAHAKAMEQFHIRGLFRTKNRCAILIYVSLAERYARIIADDGIAARVPQSIWDGAIDKLLASCRDGRVADGFLDAISLCGEVLAVHAPRTAGTSSQMPDKIYVI